MPKFNIIPSKINKVRITEDDINYYLFNDDRQWMVLGKKNLDEIEDLYSSYDLATGNVLMSGLGFGILALWVAQKKGVNSVTVVESSKEVIDMFLNTNILPSNVTIINEDINNFKTQETFDALLLDHYELEDPEDCLKNMKEIASQIPHKTFWSWSMELMFLISLDFHFDQATKENWDNFTLKYFPDEESLRSMDFESIKGYTDIWYSNYYRH